MARSLPGAQGKPKAMVGGWQEGLPRGNWASLSPIGRGSKHAQMWGVRPKGVSGRGRRQHKDPEVGERRSTWGPHWLLDEGGRK